MLIEIDITKQSFPAVDVWMNRWMILTAGNREDFNMMTVAWGSVGCMWHKPFIQVVVRPQRHTYDFIEKHDTFTVCTLPEKYRETLKMFGSVSGRDGDKLEKSGLTLRESKTVEAPCYNEADFIFECKKMYWQDFDPQGFVDPTVKEHYAAGDYHRAYFGEITAAFKVE